ncbi:MAG TPA: efflux RND transporter periplasmic adaptor subunit [Terriglobales bacterium]|nr:efflux RND transporter periplasmic adaptor subunit [Terriglobales bacterium]
MRTNIAAALLVLVWLGSACEKNQYQPPPPIEVTVAQPIEREVTIYNEFTGRTVAVEAVGIRARVQGYLQSINFVPGSDVQQGDLLFVIEPDLYQARVDQAEADRRGAEANLKAAEEQLAISRAIFERNAGSRADVVQRMQNRDLASAALGQAKAALAQAQLNLSYTHIYAPISGRIDRNYVDTGNLVGGNEATLLATIVRQDPIYAYFDVNERQLLEYRALRRQGETVGAQGGPLEARMALATDEGFPRVGRVDYASERVEPSTGTMELRAVFPNPERVILPGLFVRVQVPQTRGRAILVPEDALGADQGGRFALTVGADEVVQFRRIEIGAVVGGMRVVHSGLEADEWVIVRGLQRARPGAKVKQSRSVLEATPAATASPEPPA